MSPAFVFDSTGGGWLAWAVLRRSMREINAQHTGCGFCQLRDFLQHLHLLHAHHHPHLHQHRMVQISQHNAGDVVVSKGLDCKVHATLCEPLLDLLSIPHRVVRCNHHAHVMTHAHMPGSAVGVMAGTDAGIAGDGGPVDDVTGGTSGVVAGVGGVLDVCTGPRFAGPGTAVHRVGGAVNVNLARPRNDCNDLSPAPSLCPVI